MSVPVCDNISKHLRGWMGRGGGVGNIYYKRKSERKSWFFWHRACKTAISSRKNEWKGVSTCVWQCKQALEGLNGWDQWHWQHILQAKKWKEKSSFDTHRPRKTAISKLETEWKGVSACVWQYKQALEGQNGWEQWHWHDKFKLKKKKNVSFRHPWSQENGDFKAVKWIKRCQNLCVTI